MNCPYSKFRRLPKRVNHTWIQQRQRSHHPRHASKTRAKPLPTRAVSLPERRNSPHPRAPPTHGASATERTPHRDWVAAHPRQSRALTHALKSNASASAFLLLGAGCGTRFQFCDCQTLAQAMDNDYLSTVKIKLF
jgi:hypothetical protein